MRIGLDVSQQQLEWPEIARRARLADDLGFDGIWLFDHFKTMYGESGGPCFEAWTSLAALAAITEHARLGNMVMPRAKLLNQGMRKTLARIKAAAEG